VIPQSAALLLLLIFELMSCCAASTNGCLDLRHRAFPVGGQVSSPGAMARRAGDSVAACVEQRNVALNYNVVARRASTNHVTQL